MVPLSGLLPILTFKIHHLSCGFLFIYVFPHFNNMFTLCNTCFFMDAKRLVLHNYLAIRFVGVLRTQSLCYGMGQNTFHDSEKSHINILTKCIKNKKGPNYLSHPYFGQVWGWSPTLGKVGSLELDSKEKNTLHWGVLGVIGKVLKRKYRKWPHIGHLDICSPSYGQKKGRESNWQFDSRPLTVGKRS